MRDILVTILVFGSLPLIYKKPWWGAVMWIWISVMNPHAQGWGFARTFPFAAIIAVVSVISLVTYKGDKKLPMTPPVVLFITFLLWMSLTSLFAIHLDQVYDQWNKVLKIFGMTLVVLMLIKDREQINAVIWSIVVSIGYYGVKGGIFTIRSGGSDRVWGPAGTFIDGNNEVALAFVMVIPLMIYLLKYTVNRWARYAFMASIGLCALAALGSYSRGAMLAIAAMGVFLWLKSKEKVRLGLALALLVPLLMLAMPDQWYDRMNTIGEYKEDASAMGRVNAWYMATNLAADRLMGGGFQIYDAGVFAKYAPDPRDVHAAHSIYFQVLGEHGFIGLFLYLALGVATWRTGTWLISKTRLDPEMKWAADLATMCQVSLLGFAVGGAFLSLAYFDVPYYVMAALVAARVLVEKELKLRLASKQTVQKPSSHPLEQTRSA
ncbi:putative O-glycosylation ligase, exosortase A system-associated [Massilia sp. PWRC2]|uniref:putative O-glycosylation ligase, exosortase A system-associated n=1 Tax=Massilia sp. PWRC2 TaxID=2804626 RepID=UPI003CE7931C